MKYVLKLKELTNSKDLWSENTDAKFKKQLADLGRKESDSARYKVTAEIVGGMKRPAEDIDNYIKPLLDSITNTGLLWRDDDQIDELHIRRTHSPGLGYSDIELSIEQII